MVGAKFEHMDSLRAVAALSVVTFHVMGNTGRLPEPLEGLVLSGNLGVALFFMISGLLLYRPFVESHLDGRGTPGIAAYAWRRVLRIVPAYYAVMVAVLLFSNHADPVPGGALRYFLFGQIYWLESLPNGLSQAWTLCVEAAFYVMLPLYAIALGRLRGGTQSRRLRYELAGIGVLIAASWIFKGWVFATDSPLNQGSFIARYSPLWHVDLFAIGMALAVGTAWWRRRPESDPGHLVDRAPWLPWTIAFAALMTIAVAFGGATTRTTWFEDGAIHVLSGVMALGLLLPAVLGDQTKGRVRRVLANPRLLFLGVISYSIYLWHGGIETRVTERVYDAVPGIPGLIAAEAIVLAIVIPVAWLSYKLVEAPAMRLRHLVRDRRREAPGAAPAIAAEASAAP